MVMPIDVAHHPDYVCPLPEGHRFPMPKFNLLRRVLEAEGAERLAFHAPVAAESDQLTLVHDRDWVQRVFEGGWTAAEERRIGLPWTESLVYRTRMEVGGTILTCRKALESGIACNAAGGTHHAFASEGSGFCIFNDMAVAAALMLAEGRCRQVLVIDLDVHQGDGTARIFADQPAVFTFSMHGGKNFPLRKQTSDLDVELPDGMNDEAYLSRLDEVLDPLLDRVLPDLVIYDAGVDPHREDRLGRLGMSDEGLFDRDFRVLRACRDREIAAACVIGGGYDRDHLRLARRHALIHRAALAVYGVGMEREPKVIEGSTCPEVG